MRYVRVPYWRIVLVALAVAFMGAGLTCITLEIPGDVLREGVQCVVESILP